MSIIIGSESLVNSFREHNPQPPQLGKKPNAIISNYRAKVLVFLYDLQDCNSNRN